MRLAYETTRNLGCGADTPPCMPEEQQMNAEQQSSEQQMNAEQQLVLLFFIERGS